jgi:hypothetical protein
LPAQGEQVPRLRQVDDLAEEINKFCGIPRYVIDDRLNSAPFSTNVRRGCIGRRRIHADRGSADADRSDGPLEMGR